MYPESAEDPGGDAGEDKRGETYGSLLTLAVTATPPTQSLFQVLSAAPEVALGCQELQSLLRNLGLKPASKEAAEPL